MTVSDNDPEAAANALIDRVAAILNEAQQLVRRLERSPQPNESPIAEAHRIVYCTLTAALAAGLIWTMEDVLMVLRQASQR